MRKEKKCSVRSLRAEAGYAYAEHHKDWLRIGCDLVAEEDEAAIAAAFLREPLNAGTLDSYFEESTEKFLDRHFPDDLFEGISCSFFMLNDPEPA